MVLFVAVVAAGAFCVSLVSAVVAAGAGLLLVAATWFRCSRPGRSSRTRRRHCRPAPATRGTLARLRPAPCALAALLHTMPDCGTAPKRPRCPPKQKQRSSTDPPWADARRAVGPQPHPARSEWAIGSPLSEWPAQPPSKAQRTETPPRRQPWRGRARGAPPPTTTTTTPPWQAWSCHELLRGDGDTLLFTVFRWMLLLGSFLTCRPLAAF